jgi:hypothetical protein
MTSTMRFDRWQNSTGQAYGTVLQVVSQTSSTAYAVAITAHTGWSTFPDNGLQISITPKFSNSKVLLMANVTLGGTGSNNAAFRFIKDGNPIGVGNAVGSRARVTAFSGWSNSVDPNHVSRTVSATFLDSPATTSPIVYNIQGVTESASLLWNRSSGYADSTVIYNGTAVSTFTIMEIAQ